MPNYKIGTLECPVEECDEQVSVDSEPETDWKHGVVNISLKLSDESLEHLQQHINEAIRAGNVKSDAEDGAAKDDGGKSDAVAGGGDASAADDGAGGKDEAADDSDKSESSESTEAKAEPAKRNQSKRK